VTLVDPAADFIYKPLAVREPFTRERAKRVELEPLVSEAKGTFVRRSVRSIEPYSRVAELDDGSHLHFETAIVCVGCRAKPPFRRTSPMSILGEPIDIDALLRQAADHEFARMAFVVPPTGSWPLPVYELTLMAERHARELSLDVRIVIVTPETEPLIVFGQLASDAVASLLATRGLEVRTSVRARDEDGRIVLDPSGEHLDIGSGVALPALAGPSVPDLPADKRGFLPIEEHAQVQGVSGVYAAGDGTNFPINHGGLATQQADAAAEHIAARAGVAIEAALFHPVIRGKLITSDESLNLQADIGGGGGEGISSLDYLWWPPQKIAGKYLPPQLAGDAPHELGPPPAHGIDVEVSLDSDWYRDPMGLDPPSSPEADRWPTAQRAIRSTLVDQASPRAITPATSMLERIPSGRRELDPTTIRWVASSSTIICAARSSVSSGATVSSSVDAMLPAVSSSSRSPEALSTSTSETMPHPDLARSLTTTQWMCCMAIICATLRRGVSGGHETTPGRIASDTVACS
jgi:sulfide:quinone oxidoreductase